MATPWMDIGRIAGGYLWSRYGNRKPKLPKDKGVVKRTGKTRSGRQYNAFMQANPAMPLQPFKKAKPLSGPSLRAAQKLRESSTRTEEEYERKRKKSDMPKYGYGTLGTKYKPKFKTRAVGPLTSRLRYVDHKATERTNALYTGFNDVGPVDHMLRSLCEAFLLHYMARCGDYRQHRQPGVQGPTAIVSDPGEVGQATSVSNSVSTWTSMRLTWRQPGRVVSDVYEYSQIIHAQTGGTAHNSFDHMVGQLVAEFKDHCIRGNELAGVAMYRMDRSADLNVSLAQNAILFDPDAGRHTFEWFVKAKLKIQNTTPADSSAAEAALINNIHANPLDGLVYRFRNRVPKWQPSFMIGQPTSTSTILNDLSNMSIVGYQSVAYENVANVPETNLAATLPDQFKVPPPAPHTMFANSSGRSKIIIKPGRHKVLALTEKYSGSINGWIKKYMPKQDGPGTYAGDPQIPPGGSCNLIGLKPVFRTHDDEEVQVQLEIDRFYQGCIKKVKISTLPITNIVS